MTQAETSTSHIIEHNHGLEIQGELTKEEWRSRVKSVANRAGSIHWLIGDYLVVAEDKQWGEMYEEMEELTGFEYDTLRHDKYTASKIEFGRRRPNLSFGHHQVVASYKAEIQDILLEKAEAGKLSIKQFRAQLDSLLPLKGVQSEEWWKLGRHFLYCGDSASETFINTCKHLEGSFAFADPPYNAGVAEWDSGFVWNHDYLIDIAPIVAVTPGIASTFGFARISSMPYKWAMSYWINNGMTRGALGFGNWIYTALFTKGSLYRNAQDFIRIDLDEKWDCEPISITSSDRDPHNHKGRKPMNMLRHLIGLFTKEDQTVIDPFLGTGTTLIACEELGRSCIGAELSAEFCEYIIRRWEKETSEEAEKIMGEEAKEGMEW